MKIKMFAAVALTGIFTATYVYANPTFVPVDDMTTTPPGTMAAASPMDSSVSTTNSDMTNTGTTATTTTTTNGTDASTGTSASTSTSMTTPSDEMSADTATGDDDY